ncbi:multidrug resistance-type transporter protein [Fusarium oxysporum]|nr:multidrug resistance-type transporter protein [Fusarium oxysporum]
MGETMGSQAGSHEHPVSPEDKTVAIPDAEEKGKKFRPERTATFRDYLRIFTYATKWDFLAYAAGVMAAIGAGVATPIMFIIFGNFVKNFSGFVTGNTDHNLGQVEDDLDQLCLYMFALFLARFGLASIHKLAFRMIGVRLSAALRLHYLKHLFGQSIHVLDSLPPGHAVSTITSGSNILQMGISEKLGIFIEYTTLIVAALIVAFTFNWELALVTSSGILAIVFAVGIIFPLTVKGQAGQAKAETGAAAVASEALASIRMIMACGAEQRTADKYGVFVEEAKKHARSTSPISSAQFAVTFFGVFGTVGLTFWYGTRAFTRDRLDNVGVITVVLMAIMNIFFSLDRVSAPMLAMGKAMLAASDFFSVIDAPAPERGTLREPEVSATDDIVFEKVTFAYPNRPDIKILDELDLRIQAGKITAIVGPSGSGKSTIVGLIEGWYNLKKQHAIAETIEKDKKKGSEEEDDGSQGVELEEIGDLVELKGTVSICGRSLDNIDVKWWRSQIGLVQQEPFLFNDTIYKNVAHGLIGSAWEHEPEERKRKLVREACKEAFADEFIKKLPKEYDTDVGDGGARLSGGQRQRIAIARSIVRKPTILILDEATSAIDVRGERIVQAALDRASQGRTTIIIAHRLSTVKNAHRIVVLKKGKIIESDTHENLITMNGVYAGLVNAQALSLGEPAQVKQISESEDLNSEKDQVQSKFDDSNSSRQDDQGEPAAKRGFFGSFGRLFLESKAYWPIMILSVIFAAAAGTAQPLNAWLNARSIDLFKYQDDHPKLMHEVEFMGYMWTVFAASTGIVYFLVFVSSARVSSFIRAKYQRQYFKAILFQPAAYFDRDGHSHGTLTSRVKDDPMKLEELLGTNMAMVLISLFSIIGSIVMALCYTWKLALMSMCVIMPVCLFAGYCRFRYEAQFEQMNDEVFAESSQFASEAIGAFRTITSLTLEDSVSTRFERLCNSHVAAAYRKARWVSIVLGFSDSATLGCQALIFYYGGRLLTRGEIGLVAFFVCLMAMINAAEGLGQSLSFGPNAAQADAASNRILDARDSRLVENHGDESVPVVDGGMKIELRNVRFRYPSRQTPVFDGLSLTIERGQFAALVGASGCGKTSVISLLERFYEPEQGQILCNGKDIADINIYAYRKQLSLVAQEPTLFQGMIRDNILLSMDLSTVTDLQLHAACRDASIHDFIVSLPEGYNTVIGSRGVSLSGGQKQRIAIARALIRNPQVLLLDEATSSLDSESERLVQAALKRAAEGRTMVVVAHRLSTVQDADVIFVLGEGGRLLERGNHGELLEKRGIYYEMCQNQALDQL